MVNAMAESKKMMDREISFMKRKKAPRDMIEHEVAEKKSMGYAKGGSVRGNGCATRGFGRLSKNG
jgi:hypothetical protein